MKANYAAFCARMIQRYEGGFGWDAHDSGGPTKYGITCWDLAAHRHQKMDSMLRWAPIVKAMSLQEAEDIYATKYATATRFNELEGGSDCCLFDFGVNSGTSRAIKYAQGIVGTSMDGILGPITLKAVNDYDAAHFVNTLCDRRLRFLRGLRIWSTFGHGWTNRVTDLQHYCLGLIPRETTPLIMAASAKAYAPPDQPSIESVGAFG